MPERLHFTVLTPERVLLDVAAVRSLRVLLADGGWLSVYPGHAPLLAETVAGPVFYVTAAGTEEIALAEGIFSVSRDGVAIFTDGLAEAPSAQQVAPSVAEADAATFDRLARTLMVTLGAHSRGVLGHDGEGA